MFGKSPIVSLSYGTLWGDRVEEYTFERVDCEIGLINE